MNRKKVGPVFAVLCAVTAVLMVILIFRDSNPLMQDATLKALTTLQFASLVAALIFAALYMVFGYGKEVAKFFKLFSISFLTAQCLMAVIMTMQDTGDILTAVFCILEIVVLSLLSFGENLGKKKSRTYAIINIIANLCEIICMLVAISRVEAISIFSVAPAISKALLSIELLLAVDAKYIDKDERGTV